MSSDQFQVFALAVHMRYNELAKGELFVANIEKDVIWQAYLDAFPEGTNLKFRVNTEHDCSCCRQFIKNLGRVVAIDKHDNILTVWDIDRALLPHPYNLVAESMANFVRSAGIKSVFRSKEPTYGAAMTTERQENGIVHRWHHFHGRVDSKHHTREPDTERGLYDAAAQVYGRGLREIEPDAIEVVLDLIENNALYRGEEHKPALLALQRAQRDFANSPNQEAFIWRNAKAPFSMIRNTVIGTLLTDLSNDMPLEDAVKAYETKVAPQNYRRPTALVTQGMIEQALKTIRELDLEPALDRRHAKLSDVSINDVLWANNASKQLMRSPIESLLLREVTHKPRSVQSDAAKMSIDDFMKHVVPNATEIDLLVKNAHRSNFVSLTAPVHADARNPFKWGNKFAWSYAGDVTDAIRERVKTAGGNVEAPLRFSLAWYNFDDLDLHVVDAGGRHIYFGNKQGVLDVDMNAGGGSTRTPVENASFVAPRLGRYRIQVHQYRQREKVDIGFTMQLVFNGQVIEASWPHAVAQGDQVDVGVVSLTSDGSWHLDLNPKLQTSGRSLDIWGVKTESFVPVQTIMLSPNHWGDNDVGHKHWIFALEGCRNPDPVRGIYNEYLSNELTKHGKVFELLGARTKAPYADDQVSGVGFSSTRPTSVDVRVRNSSSTRIFNVTF